MLQQPKAALAAGAPIDAVAPAHSTPVDSALVAVPAAAAAVAKAPAEGYCLRPSDGDIWTRDEAVTLLPIQKGVSISIHTGKAWLVTYRYRNGAGKKSETHTWGPTTGLSHKDALKACLQWVWGVHREETGEIPGFSIDDL